VPNGTSPRASSAVDEIETVPSALEAPRSTIDLETVATSPLFLWAVTVTLALNLTVMAATTDQATRETLKHVLGLLGLVALLRTFWPKQQ